MPVVISFANMKGGVGKTTLCTNLAYSFLLDRFSVLVVDNDPQFNATTSLIKSDKYIEDCIKNERSKTVYNIYEKEPRVGSRKKKEKFDPGKFFQTVYEYSDAKRIRLDVIPSRIELYETLRNPFRKDYLLNTFLTKHATDYDYIFIDCPPTPSVLTYSAFAASDYVIIPVTPDFFATVGIPQFLATLTEYKNDSPDDHDVQPLAVVFSRVERVISPTTRKAMKEVKEALADYDPDIRVLQSKLSDFKVFRRALWTSDPVHTIKGRGTRGKSIATRELKAIADEIRELIEDPDE